MNKKILISSGVLFLAIALLIVALLPDENIERTGPVAAGNGNIDDAQARHEWMLKRYQDPSGEIPANIRHLEMKFARTLPNDKHQRSLEWLARGPYNIGGRTRAMAIDVNNSDRFLAGGVTGGLWLSEDAGESWTRVTGPSHFPSVTTIVQDTRPGKTHIWYYGTGEIRGGWVSTQWYRGDGMYKSVDNGLSWEPLASTQTNIPQSFDNNWNFVSRVAVDVSNDTLDVVYASTYGGLYRSEDGGNTWVQKLGTNGDPAYYTDMVITTEGVVYYSADSDAGQKGFWRSPNGLSWTNITPSGYPSDFERIVMGVNPSDEDEVYFIGSTPGFGQQIQAFFGYEDWISLWKYNYLSGNGADTNGVWVDLSTNIPNDGTPFDNFYTQASYNLMISISPHNPNVIMIGATNLYRSTDGFTSKNNTTQIGGYWKGSHLPSGSWGSYLNHHPDQHVMLFHPSDSNIIFSGNDGGVYKSFNALDSIVVWDRMNNGYNTTQAYTVGFDRTTTSDVLIGGFQDNANYFVNTTDTTADWVMPLNGDGSYMGIAPDLEYYILSINRGKVYKMDLDANGAVQDFVRIDPGQVDPDDYLFINPLLMDPNDPDILYVGGGRKLWRHTDVSGIAMNGSHDSLFTGWTYYSDTLVGTNMHISCIASSVNPAHTIWYGTDARRVFKMENAHVGNPTPVQMPLTAFPAGYISRIAVHPNCDDTVIVTISNYSMYSIFYTVDGGNSWIKGAGNLEENSNGSGSGPSVGCVEILPREDGTIYFVGTTVGAFATYELDSNNTVWTQIGTNQFGNAIIEDIKARETDGLVAFGTYGKGIYTTKISSVEALFPEISIAETESNDLAFSLYPNPVSDELNIELEKGGISELNIYDISGKLVFAKETENESMVRLNLGQLESGTYICTVRSDKILGSKRFLKQ